MYSQPELKFQKWSIFVKYKPRKRRPKLVSERIFGNIYNHRAEIRRDTFSCWQKCCNFHNPTRDNALWFSRKSGQVIKNSLTFCFPEKSTIVFIFLNHFYGRKKPSKDTLFRYMILARSMTDKAAVKWPIMQISMLLRLKHCLWSHINRE